MFHVQKHKLQDVVHMFQRVVHMFQVLEHKNLCSR
jgi:hypothetical protein